MNRRDFLQGLGGAVFAQTGRRPNILFIQTDDQRADALGFANPLVQTPNMDSIARRGVHFINSFVTTAVCSASRAAVLTGRYGSLNGVPGLGGGLNEGETTFIPALSRAGYRLGHIGKWHLTRPATPTAAGYHHDIHFISNGAHFNRKVVREGKPVVADGFIEDWLADRAVEFLQQSAAGKDPFFLTLATQVPHMDDQDRWLPREETLARYRDTKLPLPASWDDGLAGKPGYLRDGRHRQRGVEFGYADPERLRAHIRRYWASITDLDNSLGRVLAALSEYGLLQNTYIVLTGDNGWFLGEHGFSSKVLPYEESIRVPLIIAGPGVQARRERATALNVDLAPTFLQMAALRPHAGMNGRSLRSSFNGPMTGARDAFLYEAMVPTLGSWPVLAVRNHRWKYIQTFHPDKPGNLNFEELYDLGADRPELHNCAGASPMAPQLRQMRQLLSGFRREIAKTESTPHDHSPTASPHP